MSLSESQFGRDGGIGREPSQPPCLGTIELIEGESLLPDPARTKRIVFLASRSLSLKVKLVKYLVVRPWHDACRCGWSSWSKGDTKTSDGMKPIWPKKSAMPRALIWCLHEYQDSGNPWHKRTRGPVPASAASSQPAHATESPEQSRAGNQDYADHGEITVFPLQFRHVVEVHAVDSGDRGRDGDDSKP
jgi:hypothetical protein